MKRCRDCKSYKKVPSFMVGESWDRCKAGNSSDEELMYCEILNGSNDCNAYRQKIIVPWNRKVYWWKKYY